MCDKDLIVETLEKVENVIENLLDSTATILDINELSKSADGMLRLNGICMSYIIIGEEIKRIDRYTNEELLPKYPQISWNSIMGMRNRIAHGYFEIDVDLIFETLKKDIPPLLDVIKLIKIDLLTSTENND
ncbi:MAG: DUF86 domain-containing protein [Dysgonamonadaceae bacterium]|jgi:uncharacterized protein with HEPN domain|nr:DUF86 domain-containing protein [Dysgonamonadaceae bacterium]